MGQKLFRESTNLLQHFCLAKNNLRWTLSPHCWKHHGERYSKNKTGVEAASLFHVFVDTSGREEMLRNMKDSLSLSVKQMKIIV